jgi:D-tyrosyl-tRNA(Tyr) deacylase
VKAVVQRVQRAGVTVGDEVVARIGVGLLVLVGISHTDTAALADTLAGKVHRLRILRGETSVADGGAEILVVSQFTLYADTRKGRRPSWLSAAPAATAQPLVEAFVGALRDLGAPVSTGIFGADMQVELVNDGPTTILLEV